MDKVDIKIQGVNELTDAIKTAIITRFGGIFKSSVNDKIYSQDIRVADDLWLTYVNYDEDTNTLNFVLDGDASKDTALVESRLAEWAKNN